MTEPQLDLFGLPPIPAHNRTATSREAAEAARPKISQTQNRVLGAVTPNGSTRDELAQLTGLPTATICARANELVKLGKLCSSRNALTGRKLTRPTRSGKNAEVLFLSISPKEAQ